MLGVGISELMFTVAIVLMLMGPQKHTKVAEEKKDISKKTRLTYQTDRKGFEHKLKKLEKKS